MKLIVVTFIIVFTLPALFCGEDEPGRSSEPAAAGKAVTQDPDNVFRQGVALADSGKKEKARASFTRAIQLRPGFAGAHLRRGLVSLSEKKYSAARSDLGKAVVLLHGDVIQGMKRGITNFQGGNYIDAVDSFKTAGAAWNGLGEGYTGLAVVGHRTGKCAKLIREPGVAVNLAALYFYRGVCLCREGKRKDALRNLQRAIELKSDFREAFFYRAMLLADIGRPGDAIRYLTAILKLNPKNVTAHFNRGLAFYDRKMYREALDDFSAVVKSEPRNADAFFNRAMANSRLGNGEATLLDIKQAIKLNPRKSEFYNKSEAPCPRRDIEL